jgi:electron transfer flavoprotein beta subunit
MKAKRKPIDKVSLDDLGVDQTRRVNTISFAMPETRSAGVIVETAEELVQKLKDEAKVL